MSREQILVCIFLPVVGIGVFFLWKEASEAANPKPPAAAVAEPVDQSSYSAAVQRAVEGAASEEIPKGRTPEEEDIITHGKNVPASMLDSTLPHQSVDYWIAHVAGSSARLRWDVNNCPGAAKQTDSAPVCAQATLGFLDGTKFQLLILLGDQPTNPSGPVRYTQPSLLWASYKRMHQGLTPTNLGTLSKIAQESY